MFIGDLLGHTLRTIPMRDEGSRIGQREKFNCDVAWLILQEPQELRWHVRLVPVKTKGRRDPL